MMNHFFSRTYIWLSLLSLVACGENKGGDHSMKVAIEQSAAQYRLQAEALEKEDKIRIPRTVDAEGKMIYARRKWDWTVGFFPGSLWYLYDLTGDGYWKRKAECYTKYLEKEQYNTTHHDIGFVVGCSFLNGLRMGHKENTSRWSCRRLSRWLRDSGPKPVSSSRGTSIRDALCRWVGSVLSSSTT